MFGRCCRSLVGSRGVRAWVFRVLCNLAIDRGRAARSKRNLIIEADRLGDDQEATPLDVADAWAETPRDALIASEDFSSQQLNVLGLLPVMRRVIGVALAGLAWRVPQEIWAQWLHGSMSAAP